MTEHGPPHRMTRAVCAEVVITTSRRLAGRAGERGRASVRLYPHTGTPLDAAVGDLATA